MLGVLLGLLLDTLLGIGLLLGSSEATLVGEAVEVVEGVLLDNIFNDGLLLGCDEGHMLPGTSVLHMLHALGQ